MMFTHLYRQSISCILSSALLASGLSADGIIVDSAAAASHQAAMESTANGIPLINIVTPNSSGLSHNKFSEFNINPSGVILNNATSAALTQLGGWVQGNANLGTTPARVILNEVTGTSRSLLRGYGEVAGHRADVIVANPNGITVNGGGFINTSRATLTTGTAVLDGDTLNGFHVQRGDILIEGSGLNASNIDRVELYTKALVLNAQIHAKKLDTVSGENTIARDGTVVSDNVIGTEEFSIDSSALGGIYADTIRLVGTDKGVGINLPQITYANDSLELSADGHIILGSAVAENTLTSRSASLSVNDKMYGSDIGIVATDSMTNNGAVIADTLSITGGDITNNGGMIGSNQLSIHGRTITNNEVLYSANAIDLSASNTLRNTEGATIKSVGSINIHDTGTLRNESATIQADCDIAIQATAVENLSNTTPMVITNHVSRYMESQVIRGTFDWDALYVEKWLDTIDKTGYVPSYILAGGDMSINAAIHNRYSMIAANGNLYLSGSLNNEASIDAHDVVETQYYYDREHQSCGWSGCHWHNNSYWGTLSHTDTVTDHVYSTIQAGGRIYGNLISINNADVVEGSVPTNTSSQGIPPSSYFSDISIGSQYTLPSGNYSQFITVTNPALPYLIESNPLYADYNTFISSDYIISRLNLDSDTNTKRLGDARYETQLVRDAVFRLTGERYLAGFGSDTVQYQALMDNALALQGDLNLEFGVKLSATQVAALNRDIVWMEDRVVSGQHVLVPVVYLASLKNQELTAGGKIIAGGDIALAVAQGLNNGGEIRAGRNMIIVADSLTNTGGAIKSASNMLLRTTGDITNTSGTIRGNNVALVSDNGNIVSQTAQKSLDLSNHAGTSGNLSLAGERAGIWAQGDLVATAAKDITLKGSETSAGGNVVIAGENVTLSALEQNSHYKTTWNKGSSEIEKVKQHSSTLSAGGDVSINAAKDVTVHSSNIAGNNIALNAGENVNVTAANDREFRDVQTHSKGSFGRSKTTRDMTLKESVVSSAITADNITITSGKDTTLQAANLKAQENIQVDAAGDINVIAKEYREGELHYSKKKGFGGFSSSVSLDQSDAVKLHEATLKTEAKNIIMNSGKDINVVASEINAAADVQFRAFENLNIIAGEEVTSEKHESQKSSFNPLGLLSLVGIDAGPIYTQDIHNKDNYDTTAKSSTIKAGGSITADTGTTNIVGSNLSAAGDVAITADIGGINIASAQELHNASTLDKKVEVKLTDVFTSSADAYANLNSGKDTKLKFNVASATFDESTTSAQAVKNVGSSITSGQNVTLDSSDDIAIKGSDVTAKETIDLKSKTGNIAITESVDTTNINTKEKHASAEVNLVVQNEYVETGVAVNNAVKAAEQLKATKEDYSNYKREVKKLEASLETLQTQYQEKVPGIDYSDIEDLKEVISNTKEDEKYYLAAITLATADLASKTAAVASQGAAAAASTGTLGFSAGISLEMQGSKTSTDTSATHSNASSLNASNIAINTDTTADTSVTISGSNLNATDTLNIATHDLNVRSSVDTATMNSDSKQINGSITMSVYGGGASGASLGYGENHATSESETNHNSNLLANTMNINVTNDANFKGATVRAEDTLNLTVGNSLNAESVRDSSTSASHGMNASLGVSAGGNNSSLSGANASIGSNNSRSSEKQTVLTSLTGDNVNITVGENTNLKGSLIAAGDTDENGVFQDNQNLNLSTKTLTFENLANTKSSNSQGLGIGAGVNPQGDVSSVSAQLSTGTTYERTKTLATLGNGNINITDKENSDDLARLNTDTTQVDKSLFKTDTGTSASGTLDTRLLTAEGRAQIADDAKVASKITDTIQKIATLDDVGLSDFFSQTEKSVKLFTAQNEVLKNNPDLAEKLSNPNLSPDEKRAYQLELVYAIENQLGYKLIDDIKVISTDEKGQGGKEVKGFITTENDTLYSNDKNQNSTEDTIAVLGQELAGAIQKSEGVDITTDREQHNQYQDAIAKDLVDDVAFTLNNNDYKPMAQTNNHAEPTSLEEYSQLQQNNAEFVGLNKEFGDNFSFEHALSLAKENYDTTMDTLSLGPINAGNSIAGASVVKVGNSSYTRGLFYKGPYQSSVNWAYTGFKTTSIGYLDTAIFRVAEPIAIGTAAFSFGVGVGSLGVGAYKEVKGEK